MKAVGEALKKAAGKPGSQPAVEKPANRVALQKEELVFRQVLAFLSIYVVLI